MKSASTVHQTCMLFLYLVSMHVIIGNEFANRFLKDLANVARRECSQVKSLSINKLIWVWLNRGSVFKLVPKTRILASDHSSNNFFPRRVWLH